MIHRETPSAMGCVTNRYHSPKQENSTESRSDLFAWNGAGMICKERNEKRERYFDVLHC